LKKNERIKSLDFKAFGLKKMMNEKRQQNTQKNEFRTSNLQLCREPWENFYILRRGILPCCYGNPIPYSMKQWVEAWNSLELQEIRRYLSRGKLSPYCLECLSCPIVQRHLAKRSFPPRSRPFLLRFLNRIFFRIPGKIYQALEGKMRRGFT